MKHSQHTELIHNHMAIPWHHLCKEENPPITEAALPEKASIIGRTCDACCPAAREHGAFAAP